MSEHNKIKYAVCIVLMLVVLTACGPRMPEDQDVTIVDAHGDGIFGTVSRIVDADASVVCWVYDAGPNGGISCLPISETKLDR